MALEKQVVIDKIEVLENGTVQVREATRIVEDGEVISTTYHRTSYEKDADLSDADDKVIAICQVAWA